MSVRTLTRLAALGLVLAGFIGGVVLAGTAMADAEKRCEVTR